MSVLVDYPMEHDFQKQGSVCFASLALSRFGRKRRNGDVLDESCSEFITPSKFSRKEVSVDDVMKKDVTWSFEIEPCDRTNLECTLENGRLVITTRRSDNRVERRCIALPDFVDLNSIRMCFDPDSFSNRLLVGLNYQHEYRKPKHLR
ncbi:hypothetical protein FO519_007937 [Halicephalobus sp. NKZ332]|nr:hypothetical protein FO519_007937 [Halicephalobus sp. NKZ332]